MAEFIVVAVILIIIVLVVIVVAFLVQPPTLITIANYEASRKSVEWTYNIASYGACCRLIVCQSIKVKRKNKEKAIEETWPKDKRTVLRGMSDVHGAPNTMFGYKTF